MKVAIGSDHGGYLLKENLKEYLRELNIEYKDFGCKSESSTDYPDIGFKVSNEIKDGNYDRGILICGTGVGMSIVANKIKSIRASLCHDVFSAQKAREHNDANILTLGGRVITKELARKIVKIWLSTDFSKEKRHVNRLNKIKKIEDQNST
ncbi:MAG: ribose 5-phosphate isomerase B [Candidatus Caldatribacteriota bacterium]|nr:ribose 5-phosphate isomerase B [Candidatus Caldatribacteriota bacterium]